MIQIFSQNFDASTQDIIDWLYYKNQVVNRLNGKDWYKNAEFSFEITKTGIDFKVDKKQTFWGRRWSLFESAAPKVTFAENNKAFVSAIQTSLKYDFHIVNQFVAHYIEQQSLTTTNQMSVNKLLVLTEALKVGLDIPESLVTNQFKEANAFKAKHLKIITKAISETMPIPTEDNFFASFTSIVETDFVEDIGLTLFQEFLHKEFELRVFYLDEKMYSMAIFSQLDAQTAIDFRVYNHKHPNRYVPFTLPNDLKSKLIVLMKSIKLKTGSIDIVKTRDNRYVFLEVNPTGQFGMVSYNCNYYLERLIVDHLISIPITP